MEENERTAEVDTISPVEDIHLYWATGKAVDVHNNDKLDFSIKEIFPLAFSFGTSMSTTERNKILNCMNRLILTKISFYNAQSEIDILCQIFAVSRFFGAIWRIEKD